MRRGVGLRAAAGLLALAACGDPIADGMYLGEPLYFVHGEITSLDPASFSGPTYAGVVWINWAQGGEATSSQWIDVAYNEFGAQFSLALYDEPAVAELNDFSGLANGAAAGYLGTGYLLVVDDLNNDGVMQINLDNPTASTDLIRGMSSTHLLLYAKDVNDALRGYLRDERKLIINPEEIEPGYNHAKTVCGAPGELDRLMVSDGMVVGIESMQQIVADDWPCLDLF